MEQLNSLEISILRILEESQGKENAIHREDLVARLNDEMPLFLIGERKMRITIKHLQTSHGARIGSCPKGYFMVETAGELEQVCAYYHGYAMSSLHSEARLRKMSLGELVGQLSLGLGGQDDPISR